jgi:hypothetical protein
MSKDIILKAENISKATAPRAGRNRRIESDLVDGGIKFAGEGRI